MSRSYVIGAGVHYIYNIVYAYDLKISLNGTLAVDSPFQILAVYLLLNNRLALQLCAPETLSS